MIPEVAVYAEVAVITVALVASLSGITVFLVRAVRPSRKPAEHSLPGQTEAQLAQLQQSIDAIALEVERIAEAQRFSAKLLSERNEARAELKP